MTLEEGGCGKEIAWRVKYTVRVLKRLLRAQIFV